MDPFQALSEIPNLVADYKATVNRLIEVEKELSALKADKFVPLQWVADLWSVEPKTARQMIQVLAGSPKSKEQVKVLSYGAGVVRYRRADIERITESSLVSLRDMLTQKRANRTKIRSIN